MTLAAKPGRTAIIAGRGRLPRLLAEALEDAGEAPLIVAPAGFAPDDTGGRPVAEFRIERLAPFWDRLHEQGVARVVFAGAVQRPRLDPEMFDTRTAALVPRLVGAMQAGDDATLRAVIALFEEDGFTVAGVDDVAPALLPGAGVLGRVAPSEADAADAGRAARIVAALGAVDVGQGAVVARGLCLAVEALPGTDAMLAQVAGLGHPPGAGVFFKAAKPGQDRRVDLPAIGPDTVARAAAAGLRGIAFQAGGVLLIDREDCIARADAAGLFLWSRPESGPE
jgi:hypothetical protein